MEQTMITVLYFHNYEYGTVQSHRCERTEALHNESCVFTLCSPYAANNQGLMAEEGAIDILVDMLASNHPHLQRQAAKALANLGVNTPNKERIFTAGGVPPLVQLASSKSRGVAVEAVAALANLAVNGGPNYDE